MTLVNARRRDAPYLIPHALASLGSAMMFGGGWWLSGGGYFWPRWTWLGLAVSVALHGALGRALQVEPGLRRWLALHAAVGSILAPLGPAVWLCSGGGYFWPIWPICGLTVMLGGHAWVVFLVLTARADAAVGHWLIDPE